MQLAVLPANQAVSVPVVAPLAPQPVTVPSVTTSESVPVLCEVAVPEEVVKGGDFPQVVFLGNIAPPVQPTASTQQQHGSRGGAAAAAEVSYGWDKSIQTGDTKDTSSSHTAQSMRLIFGTQGFQQGSGLSVLGLVPLEKVEPPQRQTLVLGSPIGGVHGVQGGTNIARFHRVNRPL